MSDRPAAPDAENGHAIAAASQRAQAVRLRFDRELDDLIDAIHELRESLHGHSLPPAGDGTADGHEDTR